MSWKEISGGTKKMSNTKNELAPPGEEAAEWRKLAHGWEAQARRLARLKCHHEDQAVDLGLVMESCAEFLELVTEVIKKACDLKGKDGKKNVEKLERALTKWPEYLETETNYWEKRLRVQKGGTEADAMKEELKEQEKQADELEEELETIEEKIKKDIVPMQQSDPRLGVCPYCDRIYASAKWLKRHVREDHPGQPTTGIDEDRVSFECPHGCGKTYQTRGWLMRHLQDKHGERPQSDEAADSNPIYCPHCDKKYASVGWLNRHVQKDHEGETDPDIDACGMRVPCPFCDRKYASFVSLKKRLKDKHENEAITGSDEDSVRLSCPHCKEV
ncbi:unnamed protein product [Trypanosoma congolense IL3000]|uniref:WGS project CAEQ00000000 data, annotated contig 1195 n=1 Tax=Trypanosoma congolense (strain IL3000) TaxID=1068625 RepID=F9W4L0_TRYCI|nr:unnamed protein product [Trypanosoma congolense IL3000]